MSSAQKQMWSEYILQHVCVPVYVMAEISIQACDVAYFLLIQSHCKLAASGYFQNRAKSANCWIENFTAKSEKNLLDLPAY